MYKIDQTPYVLQIAKQDEYGLTHEFDISDWLAEYPDLAVGIAVVRPEETEDDAEPATTVIDGTTMTWTIRPWETEKPGHGTAEARMLSVDTNGNPVKVKSAIIRTFVVPSIADGLPTDPQMSYIDQVIVYANIANEKYNLAIDEANRAHDERVLAEEENRLAGVARDAADGFAGSAQTAQGLAESARGDAYIYADYAEENATIARDAAIESIAAKNLSLQYRDATQGYAQSALGAKQGAESARDLAQGYVDTFLPAEQSRSSAEGVREQNETSRVEAESLRVIAETARQNARIKSSHADGDNLVFTKQDNTIFVVTDALKSVNAATEAATEAAGLTTDAIARANEISETMEGIAPRWSDVNISVSALGEGVAPTASIAQGETGTSISLGIPKGDTGAQGPIGNVMYATFDIDFETGELMMATPDGYTGPTFSINDETGELEVSI